jgi:hypothetical protein
VCGHGFERAGEACLAIAVPLNAHVDATGNGWECNEPYRRRAGRCESP